ncbi:Hypothetical predicted protein, partial [Olea europaea subsp. europaea]
KRKPNVEAPLTEITDPLSAIADLTPSLGRRSSTSKSLPLSVESPEAEHNVEGYLLPCDCQRNRTKAKDTGLIEFDYCIPEEARLWAHISQRSNLKYVKTVIDLFNDRQRDEFRNSPFEYLAEVAEIQFSTQLIQQLVFRTIRTDKVNKLWFNVQGNMMRFDLQEYTLVTGLRCGVFREGDEFDRVLERAHVNSRRSFQCPDNNVEIDLRTLSIVDNLDIFFAYPWGRVDYRRLLHGFRGFWVKKFLKAKRRQEKEVWAYEAVPEIGERFGQRVGERMPRLLSFSFLMYNCTLQLHVYATLRPTDVEAEQQYFSTLVLYDDPPVPMLDEIARNVVGPQFNTSHGGSGSGGQLVRQESDEGVSSGGSGEDETS